MNTYKMRVRVWFTDDATGEEKCIVRTVMFGSRSTMSTVFERLSEWAKREFREREGVGVELLTFQLVPTKEIVMLD